MFKKTLCNSISKSGLFASAVQHYLDTGHRKAAAAWASPEPKWREPCLDDGGFTWGCHRLLDGGFT